MRLPVRLDRAHVLPVPLQRQGARPPGVDQLGQTVVAEVLEPVLAISSASRSRVSSRASGSNAKTSAVTVVERGWSGLCAYPVTAPWSVSTTP